MNVITEKEHQALKVCDFVPKRVMEILDPKKVTIRDEVKRAEEIARRKLLWKVEQTLTKKGYHLGQTITLQKRIVVNEKEVSLDDKMLDCLTRNGTWNFFFAGYDTEKKKFIVGRYFRDRQAPYFYILPSFKFIVEESNDKKG